MKNPKLNKPKKTSHLYYFALAGLLGGQVALHQLSPENLLTADFVQLSEEAELSSTSRTRTRRSTESRDSESHFESKRREKGVSGYNCELTRSHLKNRSSVICPSAVTEMKMNVNGDRDKVRRSLRNKKVKFESHVQLRKKERVNSMGREIFGHDDEKEESQSKENVFELIVTTKARNCSFCPKQTERKVFTSDDVAFVNDPSEAINDFVTEVHEEYVETSIEESERLLKVGNVKRKRADLAFNCKIEDVYVGRGEDYLDEEPKKLSAEERLECLEDRVTGEGDTKKAYNLYKKELRPLLNEALASKETREDGQRVLGTLLNRSSFASKLPSYLPFGSSISLIRDADRFQTDLRNLQVRLNHGKSRLAALPDGPGKDFQTNLFLNQANSQMNYMNNHIDRRFLEASSANPEWVSDDVSFWTNHLGNLSGSDIFDNDITERTRELLAEYDHNGERLTRAGSHRIVDNPATFRLNTLSVARLSEDRIGGRRSYNDRRNDDYRSRNGLNRNNDYRSRNTYQNSNRRSGGITARQRLGAR